MLMLFRLLLFITILFFLFCFFFINLNFFLLILFCLIIYILILIKVAVFTLIERKVMGSIQRRLGPNVIGIGGVLQPFADGLKLATKEMIVPLSSTSFLFFLAPIWSFFLSLISWAFIPFHFLGSFVNPNLGFLLILMLSSLNIYGLLIGGWSSNSKYALLGSIRSAAQMISYEVVFSFILMPIFIISRSLNLLEISIFTSFFLENYFFLYFLGFLPISIMFFIIIVAETNRAPFDLPEAEAELVAGFNVEYSSFIFALFFLGEYSSILIMSSLFVIFFLGSWGIFYPFSLFFLNNNWFFQTFIFSIKLLFVCYLFIWIRATFPRLRFDKLMFICWEIFLPFIFGYLIYFSIVAI